MTSDALRSQVIALTPVDERERLSIAQTLERLTWAGDPLDEHANDHHITSSAFVVSSRGVILHEHKLLGIWVQPGGHVDAGETPEVACVRETREETGLVARHFDPASIFHVDVHPGPNGHTHYDLRYVLVSDPIDPSPPDGESPEVYWFDYPSALARCEPALQSALRKLSELSDTFGVRN
ncbi:MAG: NUDIX domain-containing protein [Acidimicrobiales bacterium]